MQILHAGVVYRLSPLTAEGVSLRRLRAPPKTQAMVECFHGFIHRLRQFYESYWFCQDKKSPNQINLFLWMKTARKRVKLEASWGWFSSARRGCHEDDLIIRSQIRLQTIQIADVMSVYEDVEMAVEISL